MMSEKLKIFICYSRSYSYAAAHMESILEAQFDVFWDRYIENAVPWEENLKKEIVERDIFIYLLTPESVSSPYCRREYNCAVEARKKFVPVRLHRNTNTPLPIRKIQEIDFSDFGGKSFEIGISELSDSILNAVELDPTKHRLDLPEDRSFAKALEKTEFIVTQIQAGKLRGQHNSEERVILETLCDIVGDSDLLVHIEHFRKAIDGLENLVVSVEAQKALDRIERLQNYNQQFPLKSQPKPASNRE
jgi:hypothetical protein